ncbi:putative protein kinase-like domain [Rosellinia necatrix]|uniref:Uncharacterized protein n=1 Tax=Rosellinia necatrix TaxID=77044 RepID=A0A1W2TWU9_ROSNE|nr:putative protein kinase-like domain [Rosellinia necatrix]
MVQRKHHKSSSSQDNAGPSTENSRQSKKHPGQESPKSKKDSPDQHVDLYCAIYIPQFGNYYTWAFAIYNPTGQQWGLFRVIQKIVDGPFIPRRLEINPKDLLRCLSLVHLGQMNAYWSPNFIDAIGRIAVPGEGLSWNCQDYVMDIWEMMLSMGMIDERTWSTGKRRMMPYYGPDYGGCENQDQEELEYEEDDN